MRIEMPMGSRRLSRVLRARGRAWLAGLVAVVLVAVGLVVVVLPPAAPVSAVPPACPAGADEAGVAAAQAVECDGPVEVLGARSEFSSTYANPDGSMTLEQHVSPVRARRGDDWVPVDTSLRKTPAGLEPVAAVLPLVFSRGGDGPLVRLSDRGRELALSWSGPLPEPDVSGSSALYRDVLPGVDLLVTAEALGFSQVLIVKSAQAAANPGLAEVRLGLQTVGVTVSAAPGGGLVALDAEGRRVFSALAPMMWDSGKETVAPPVKEPEGSPDLSAGDGQGGGGSAGEAGGGGDRPQKQAVMPVRVDDGEVVLTPDASILSDPSTRFPVFIDPAWTPNLSPNLFRTLWSKFPDSTGTLNNGATKGDAGVGRTCDTFSGSTCTSPQHVIRSMFRFSTTSVAGLHVLSAEFRIEQKHSWTCSPKSNAAVWLTTEVSTSSTWNNQPYWNGDFKAQTAANRRLDALYGCQGPGVVEFDVTNHVRNSAENSFSTVTLGMRALDEGTVNQWKRFQSSTARLLIHYNHKPDKPTNRLSHGEPCKTGTDRPYVFTTTPVLSALQRDVDNESSLTTDFHWFPVGGTPSGTNKVSQSGGNPGTVSATIPSGKLTDGASYGWQARTTDRTDTGDWSARCEFTVDATNPNPPASVGSTQYPSDGQLHGGVGLPGTFTIAPAVTRPHEVVAFAWTLDTGVAAASAATVPADSSFGGSVTLFPLKDGNNTLRVWSKDRAGRFSTPVDYSFSVRAGSGPAAEWTFDESSGAAGDGTGHGNTLTPSGGSSRTTGRGGIPHALTLDGATGFAATAGQVSTPHPDTNVMTPVRTDTSFTVTARVMLAGSGGSTKPTVVSVNGSRTSAFTLDYDPAAASGAGRWRFTMAGSDVDAPSVFAVLSDAAPTVGKWTHLAGVYDVATHTLRLYVDGVAQTETAALTGGFNATGAFTVGRRVWAGATSDYFTGSIDDVRLYSFAVTAAAVTDLARPLAPTVTFPNGPEATAGSTLQVQFDANGDTNVSSFQYSVGDALDLSAAPSTPGGVAEVSLPVGSALGPSTVHARSVAGTLTGATSVGLFDVTSAGTSIAGTVWELQTFGPVAGADVSLNPGDRHTVSGVDGGYAIDGFPVGDYTIAAQAGGPCGPRTSSEVHVPEGGALVDLYLESYTDGQGYSCTDGTASFVSADDTVLSLTGDDAVTHVDLPFVFPFYGQPFRDAWVDTNGIVSFFDPGQSHPYPVTGSMPSIAAPNAVVAPFWDDLVVDASASVRTAVVGSGDSQQFVIEWRNVHRKGSTAQRLSFEVLLSKDGTVTTHYTGLDNDPERGEFAAVGIEAPGGEVGLVYATTTPALASGQAVVFDYVGEGIPVQLYDLSGTLRDTANAPVVGATITLQPSGLSTVTGPGGVWAFTDLVADSYTISSAIGGRCAATVSSVVDLDADTVHDLHLRADYGNLGYACATGVSGYIAANTVIDLTGDDEWEEVSLPFPVTLHGQQYEAATVSTNGFLTLGGEPVNDGGANTALPADQPAAVVAPFWDDLTIDSSASVRHDTVGTAPNRTFIVEWRNARINNGGDRVTFEAWFAEGGQISYHYGTLTTDAQLGGGATVGLQEQSNALAAQYSHNETALTSNGSITYTPAPAGTVTGTLTASVTGAAIAGATVTLLPAGTTATTDSEGIYEFTGVPVGRHTVWAQSADNTCAGQYAIQDFHYSGTQVQVDVSILGGGGDEGGYTCTTGPAAYLHPTDDEPYDLGDDEIFSTDLPFPITLYGLTYTEAWVDTNGVITFTNPTDSAWFATPIPSPPPGPGEEARHNAAVYPFWDDWIVDEQSSIAEQTYGTAPNRTFVVEWSNVTNYYDPTARVSFEVVFAENGRITFNYADIDPASFRERGGAGTVGIENASGTIAFQYLHAQTWLSNGTSITFTPGETGDTTGDVHGTVTCQGTPAAGATVATAGMSTTTDTGGDYELTNVPAGDYIVIATLPSGACIGSHTAPLTVGNDTSSTVSFPLTATPPGADYTVTEQPGTFVTATTILTSVTGDEGTEQVSLPFPVTLYGQTYNTAWVDTNGLITFAEPDGEMWDANPIPSPPADFQPNAALYPLWDDWWVDNQAEVRVATFGTAPTRTFVVEWHNIRLYEDTDVRASFEVILHEAGGYTFAYTDINGGFFQSGGGATIGIENADGTIALQYAYRHPVARNGVTVHITPPAP